MEKFLLSLLQIDLVKKVCYYLCMAFILQIGKITFILAGAMQVSNGAKVVHFFFPLRK